MKIMEKITHFYIKHIKRWMFCPNCSGDGKLDSKMRVNKNTNEWVCEDCGYTLSCKEFEEGVTFWFCDNCGTFLNKQDGFSENNKKWICAKCGFDNDVTDENIID